MQHLLKELLDRKISDLGIAARAIHCAPDFSVQGAVKTLRETHIGSLVVVEGLKVVGIFTERDFLEKVALQDIDLRETHVSAYMTPNPVCVQKHETIGTVINKMREGRFRHIVIVDGYGNLEKVVSLREIMDYLMGTIAQAA